MLLRVGYFDFHFSNESAFQQKKKKKKKHFGTLDSVRQR